MFSKSIACNTISKLWPQSNCGTHADWTTWIEAWKLNDFSCHSQGTNQKSVQTPNKAKWLLEIFLRKSCYHFQLEKYIHLGEWNNLFYLQRFYWKLVLPICWWFFWRIYNEYVSIELDFVEHPIAYLLSEVFLHILLACSNQTSLFQGYLANVFPRGKFNISTVNSNRYCVHVLQLAFVHFALNYFDFLLWILTRKKLWKLLNFV